MKRVALYVRVRHAVRIEGLSERAAARRFGIDPRTVSKMLKFSVPPGYRRSRPPVRPKLDPFVAIIDRILEEDKSRPKKQQHTSKRLFERLRDEYGFTGGVTIVKDYVAGYRQRSQEMFVPLTRRWILARLLASLAGWSVRFISSLFTCRIRTPVLSWPIRRRRPKLFATGT
jgi:transposase